MELKIAKTDICVTENSAAITITTIPADVKDGQPVTVELPLHAEMSTVMVSGESDGKVFNVNSMPVSGTTTMKRKAETLPEALIAIHASAPQGGTHYVPSTPDDPKGVFRVLKLGNGATKVHRQDCAQELGRLEGFDVKMKGTELPDFEATVPLRKMQITPIGSYRAAVFHVKFTTMAWSVRFRTKIIVSEEEKTCVASLSASLILRDTAHPIPAGKITVSGQSIAMAPLPTATATPACMDSDGNEAAIVIGEDVPEAAPEAPLTINGFELNLPFPITANDNCLFVRNFSLSATRIIGNSLVEFDSIRHGFVFTNTSGVPLPKSISCGIMAVKSMSAIDLCGKELQVPFDGLAPGAEFKCSIGTSEVGRIMGDTIKFNRPLDCKLDITIPNPPYSDGKAKINPEAEAVFGKGSITLVRTKRGSNVFSVITEVPPNVEPGKTYSIGVL